MVVNTFSLYKPVISPKDIVQEPFIICGAWKFLGQKKIHTTCVSSRDAISSMDKHVVKELREAIEEADIIIGHNGDAFDLSYLKGRCLRHGLDPISFVKTIDTLKVARKHFKRLPSKRLDYLGEILGVGRKIVNSPGLWNRCEQGDKKALAEMVKYNKQDVLLLEDVYLKLRPWIDNHPDVNILTDKEEVLNPCPNCGSSHTIKHGQIVNNKTLYQKHLCKDCSTYFKGKRVK
jgi:hypothetical protein